MVKMYVPTPLSYFVSADLAFWDKLLVTVESLLKGAVKDLDKYIDGLLRNEDFVATLKAEMEEVFGYPVGIPDIHGDFEEEYRELREFFPNTLRKWLFVAIYAFVEKVLFELCRQKEREAGKRGSPLSQSVEDFFDRSQSYLLQSKKYLKKVAGLSDFPVNYEWHEIYSHYRRLRNCIVHSGGVLPRDEEAEEKTGVRVLKKYIERASSLRCLDSGAIVIGEGFCEEVLQTARSFFKQLFKALGQEMP
jgi:hypothetical protein